MKHPGQSMGEYGLALGLMAVIAVIALTQFSGAVNSALSETGKSISSSVSNTLQATGNTMCRMMGCKRP